MCGINDQPVGERGAGTQGEFQALFVNVARGTFDERSGSGGVLDIKQRPPTCGFELTLDGMIPYAKRTF